MGALAQTPVGSPDEAGQIFVVGYNGSGTTMIAECLGRHQQVYWFPGETGLIPFFLDKGAERTDLGLGRSATQLLDQVGAESVRRWLPFAMIIRFAGVPPTLPSKMTGSSSGVIWVSLSVDPLGRWGA